MRHNKEHINEIVNKTAEIDKNKSWCFVRMNKIDKSLKRLINEEGTQTGHTGNQKSWLEDDRAI